MEHSSLSSRDGTSLAVRRWDPDGEPKAEVVLVHGLAEHMGRYAHVGEALRAAGFKVLGLELRGHGHSGGERGHVLRWSDYTDDLAAAFKEVGGPAFIVAHSMGGLVSIDALLTRSDIQARGLVISNPLLGIAFEPPKLKVLAGRLLSRVLPGLSLTNELDARLLSRDPEVVRRYVEDPLVFNTITPRWFTEHTKAMARAHSQAGELTLPTLCLLGDKDGIVDHHAGSRFFDGVGATDKTRIVYEGFYHELFNEPEKQRVLNDVIQWLGARC